MFEVVIDHIGTTVSRKTDDEHEYEHDRKAQNKFHAYLEMLKPFHERYPL